VETERSCWVVRVWLPDRPGALGAVASRIGAVRGDVIAIDVLERGGGRAVDELTVALADPELIDLLAAEIGQVDGVDVEDVRPAGGPGTDRAVTAVRAAGRITGVETIHELLESACSETLALFGADWVVLLDVGAAEHAAVAGLDPPPAAWLTAFVLGISGDEFGGPASNPRRMVEDLATSRIGSLDMTMVLSRMRLPLRAVEREVLDELALLIGGRASQLAPAGLARPSKTMGLITERSA